MDNLSLRLLQAQRGPVLCGELLLYAEHPPQNPREWEQWVRTTGKVLAKRQVAYQERATSGINNTLRLVHTPVAAHASRRSGSGTSTSATPASHWACFSRMRGNVHVRF